MSLGESFSEFVHWEKPNSKILRPGREKSASDFSASVVLVLVVFCFLFLLAGLFRVQIFQGQYFRALASSNRTRDKVIHAPRGTIYDRNGVILAGSDGAFRLTKCEQNVPCQTAMLSKTEALKIESGGLLTNESLEIDSQRYYPKNDAAGFLTGYVSEVTAEELALSTNYALGDRVGRTGVEEQYEELLRGVDGKELVETDARGNRLRVLGEIPAKSGQDVHLTIDWNLQEEAHKALSGVKGAVVAASPTTGEILVLASSPAFDPNIFTQLTWESPTRNDQIGRTLTDPALPMFNRAISGTFPPGSIFKIVTAIAGLESGKITEATRIDDPGVLVIGPYKFPNWKWLRGQGTQGNLNVVSALKVSNDIFFYRAGEYTGLDNLEAWSTKLGLGSKSGIDMPGEAGGLFPGAKWRQENARSWYLGDTYHLAIGQGDVLVTPLQANIWTNVVASGGKLCRPHILSSLSALCHDLGISKKTLDLVKEGLIEACSPGGTAYPLFGFTVDRVHSSVGSTVNSEPSSTRIPIQLACKTGTAEFGDPADYDTHAWLTAYAPADKPEISVTVLVEGGGEGSDVAAPIVKKVLEEWFGR